MRFGVFLELQQMSVGVLHVPERFKDQNRRVLSAISRIQTSGIVLGPTPPDISSRAVGLIKLSPEFSGESC
jgi:hypothetical protein